MKKFALFLLLWSTAFAQTDTSKLQTPILPEIVPEDVSLSSFVSLTTPELPQSGFEGWFGPEALGGGINRFNRKDNVPANQAVTLINLLPRGDGWEKREGYQKIMIANIGTVYGMAMSDSANSRTRLCVVGDDDLYVTEELYNGTYTDIGNTTAMSTFFTSTPFGLVVSNGEDSSRIYDGVSLTALGYCDTGRVSYDWTISTDTVWIVDSSRYWIPDYWIGYYLKFSTTNPESLWRIIDNGPDSILAIATESDDTTRTGETFSIISQPDSMTGDLTYPKGKAVAYYDQRFFVSSAWPNTPNRIWYSKQRLINDIDIDAIIDLDMDAQDEIQCMEIFNGYLVVFGSNSIYGIDQNLQATPITKTLGCSAPKSVAVGDDYIYFLSQPRGVYRWNGNMYGSLSYKLQKISDPIDDILSSVGAEILDDACGIYTDKQYWLSYSPDSCLVFDERTEQWYQQGFGFTEALPLVGDFRIQASEVLYPSSTVSNTWSITGGATAWEVIDDQSSDADYLSGNSTTARLGFTNLSNYATGATINYIMVGCRAKVITAGYGGAFIRIGVRANSQTYQLVDLGADLSGNWNTYLSGNIYNNPVTGMPWTKGDLDSLVLDIFGWVDYGHTDYLSGFWVIPYYRSDLPTHDFLFTSTNKNFIYQYGGTFADDTTSDGTYNVTGIVPTAYYQSGWFNSGSLIDQFIATKFYFDKMVDGTSIVYIYKDFESDPVETLSLANSTDTTAIEWVTPDLRGSHFSVGIESSADTCEIKGWGLQLQTIGER